MNPDEVLKYIEEHNTRSNELLDEGMSIITKIKKMNLDISNEIKNQNEVILELDKNLNRGQEQTQKGITNLNDALQNISTLHLTIAMIVQIIFIIYLLL